MSAQDLFQQGKEALEKGERSKAVDLLKRAIEQDSENVEIWVALAESLDDVAEKRIALSTILQLDPENIFAKGELEQTEKPKVDRKDDEELVPGITRRTARLTGIGLGVFTVVMFGITFMFVSGQNASRENERRQVAQAFANQTATLAVATQMQETAQAEQTEIALQMTATQEAIVSPTPTATATRSRGADLPTPIPPTPTPTEVITRQYPLPPAGLPGKLIAWGGINPGSRQFLRFRQYNPSDPVPTPFMEEFAQFPTVDQRGTSVVFLQPIQNTWRLFLVNSANPDPNLGKDFSVELVRQNVKEPTRPRISRDGARMVFIGTSPNGTQAVYLYDFTVRPEQVVRVTFDEANYTSAAVSGDTIVAVKESASGTDLVMMKLADAPNGFPQTPLTTDGNARVESSPDFSSDGVFVIFSAYTSNPADNDIYLGRIQGNTFANEIVISTTGDEIYPTFSPDGSYIAYSNNITGTYNLFIFERVNRTTYQLTDDSAPVYLGGWSN